MRLPNRWIGRDRPRPYLPQSQHPSPFFFFYCGIYTEISFAIENPKSTPACSGSNSGNDSTDVARN